MRDFTDVALISVLGGLLTLYSMKWRLAKMGLDPDSGHWPPTKWDAIQVPRTVFKMQPLDVTLSWLCIMFIMFAVITLILYPLAMWYVLSK
jgi:hypothetical protein